MVRQNGEFIDPPLGKDRFDFDAEPLTEDDIKSMKDTRKAEE